VAVDYDAIKVKVSAAMAKVRQGSVSLMVKTAGVGPLHNPGSPGVTETPLDAAVSGVSLKYIDGKTVTTSDLMVRAGVVDGVTPKKGDFISIDGRRREIIEFIPKPAAGTVLQWVFLVRGDGV
jgi:hypothetical protein